MVVEIVVFGWVYIVVVEVFFVRLVKADWLLMMMVGDGSVEL